MNNFKFVRRCWTWASRILLVTGSVLSIEGIAAIDLRSYIVSGTTAEVVIVVGLQIYALGVISVTAHTWDRWNLSDARPISSIGVLLFFILLLPPAFLVR
ncbi:MAG: hypothetical protein JET69_04010 [Methanomassiliicoccales archaeon]|nr:hypothetical protein [Methanomassiliicoccales archaeon]